MMENTDFLPIPLNLPGEQQRLTDELDALILEWNNLEQALRLCVSIEEFLVTGIQVGDRMADINTRIREINKEKLRLYEEMDKLCTVHNN